MGVRPTLTIVDNRTADEYELSIANNAIRATDLRQIKASCPGANRPVNGLLVFDPGLRNTAVVESAVAHL